MRQPVEVLLSGFADESANRKTAVEQFAAFAALGLQYYSIRFIDVGSGVKNVMKLTKQEIRQVRQWQQEYGLKVSSIGSPIGKVKLQDIDDGTSNVYVPFKKYLAEDVRRVCQVAHAFETHLIRGFSFYPPKGADPRQYLAQAVDQLGQIADLCQKEQLLFGLEVEANLVGQNGYLLAEIYRQLHHPALVLVFDAANILCQGYSPAETFEQYLAMKPGIGWMHVKDYRYRPQATKGGHVDEEALRHFVPVDLGDSGYDRILRDFASSIPALQRRLKRHAVPGVFLELEPHLKGGGQFGGFSGPDGMGVALRSLCRLLDYLGLHYHLRDFEDIRAARGF